MRRNIAIFTATAAGVILLAAGAVIALNSHGSIPQREVPEFVMPETPSDSTSATAEFPNITPSESADVSSVEAPVETTPAALPVTSAEVEPEAPPSTEPENPAETAPKTSSDDLPETTATSPPQTAAATQPEIPAESEPEPLLENVQISSVDPEHYIRFEFQPDGILLSGVYTGESISIITVYNNGIACDDLIYTESGFSGSVDTSSLGEGYYILRFKTISGSIMDYVFQITEQGAQALPEDKLPGEKNLTVTKAPLEIPQDTVLKLITFDGDQERAAELLRQVQKLSDAVCAGISNDLGKARALAEWVSRNIYYDSDARENGVTDDMLTLEYVLENHRSVCYGWTNLYSALCQAQGIECLNMNGSVVTGSRSFLQTEPSDERAHSWNLLIIDGEKIWVDTVWDSTNSYKYGAYVQGVTDLQYFGITNSVLAQNHRAERCEHRDYFGAVNQ